jgi:Leucine-rich repeat (LRR) protein
MRVPGWLYKLTTLNFLNMRSTGLAELPERIAKLHGLSTLLLDENNLSDEAKDGPRMVRESRAFLQGAH